MADLEARADDGDAAAGRPSSDDAETVQNGHAIEPKTDVDDAETAASPASDPAASGEAINDSTLSIAPDEAHDEHAPDPLPEVQIHKVQTTNGSTTPSQQTPSGRSRTDSVSTIGTSATQSSTRSSLVFVIGALETISASRDAQRRKDLKDAVRLALDKIKTDGEQIDPKILFEALKLAAEVGSENIVTTALDCIGKLISYSYFPVPSGSEQEGEESLIDQAIDTICDCFDGETTADRIQLQIIISLLAAVLNDKVVVHGSGLLKAVRQMYNIFLHSKSTRNQQVAQGTLSQMVNTVFERARVRLASKETRHHMRKVSARSISMASHERIDTPEIDDAQDTPGIEEDATEESNTPVDKDGGAKMTLQTFERRGSFDEDRLKEGPTTVTKPNESKSQSRYTNSDLTEDDVEDEIYMKDAFLVFRAMCKISIKPLRPEEILDIRSQGMRAKLLSLHIVHLVLLNNITLFQSPNAIIRSSTNGEATQLTQAIKQLLCQSLSRNGASSVNRVFEVGCEIFWVMYKHLRVLLKKEVEVFLKEIYLSIMENRTAPLFQKQCIVNVLERLAGDSRALVETYLNYDCDRTASDNMFQRTVEHLSRLASNPVTITSIQQHAYQNQQHKGMTLADWQTKGTLPPSLSTAAITQTNPDEAGFPPEYAMKQQALFTLVEILRSLVHWAERHALAQAGGRDESNPNSFDEPRESSDVKFSSSPATGTNTPPIGTPVVEDDPQELERAKARKTALVNAVRQFNFKPKRGLKALIDGGFIQDREPRSIAAFFLSNQQLDKAALGEFLGEGDAENVEIMHAFVDLMAFEKTRFVDALRRFLQAFRLPGEAQKIDRFMLKFAERYINGNPNAFANADTAYVLAYSVILLNTDQHSTKMKGRRMTPEDFIKNNRGINDNADLPEEYLKGIYEDICHNEIVLNTEREAAANLGYAQPSSGFSIGQALANAGRDLQREAFMQRSEEMANKTEQLFKSLVKAQKRGSAKMSVSKFIPATSFRHVGPMLDVTWMAFLTAFSGCAQDTNNLETVRVCMDGFKLAIQIACSFDLESPRAAFVSAISRFTNLYNLSEMKAKNVEALRVMLDIANTEGNALKESWRDIITTISLLDRFQLISEGVDERIVPDVLRTPQPNRRQSLQVPKSKSRSSQSVYRSDVAEESRSAGIVMGVDRIFASSAKLSGDAIVHFVRALTQVSWQEIESSGESQEPRTFSLQKLVEVAEYNMDRVRFEWTSIWQVLGEHFTQVGCHHNTKVVHFAMNCLRQLSIRFLDLEELPGFKFQKDFLKPFEHIINNTKVVQVKEIVLHSLIQMIRARGQNIRSGWRTIFGVFTVAAREKFGKSRLITADSKEGVVTLAFDNVIQIYNERFGTIILQGAFADLAVCLTDFSKNARFQKKSLQAIELLKALIPRMLKTPECPLSQKASAKSAKQPSHQTSEEQYWFPVLFAFHDVLMTGDDLEVRSRALNYLFDSLVRYGADFPPEFWDTIWRQLLYPIFMVLKSKQELNRVVNHEELSVWLSTTMIQALRNMMSLFNHYFESLEYMLDRFLDLLALCICQENDTLARIGSNCLQTLILQNVHKFTPLHWGKIVTCFVELFTRTEATALFSAAAAATYITSPTLNGDADPMEAVNMGSLKLSSKPHSRQPSQAKTRSNTDPVVSNGDQPPTPGEASASAPTSALEDYRPDSSIQQPVVVSAARRRFFNQIITKCVLQLLMIETVNELFTNDNVYTRIPSSELLRLMSLLKKSYHFAKRFNDDLDLRNRLFQEGFMKQPPNLLKQESGSASVYVNILFRMYHDAGEERKNNREQTEAALIPLCLDIIESYIQLKEETQQRNIVTWRTVVVDVVDGYANFPPEGFEKHTAVFAPLAVALLGRDMGPDLQRAVQALFQRILELHYPDLPPLAASLQSVPPTPSSPRPSVFSSRRASRASMR